MFGSGNVILGVLAFSGIFGVLACGFAFFPTYILSAIKVILRN